jgi:hypothetical protein
VVHISAYMRDLGIKLTSGLQDHVQLPSILLPAGGSPPSKPGYVKVRRLVHATQKKTEMLVVGETEKQFVQTAEIFPRN